MATRILTHKYRIIPFKLNQRARVFLNNEWWSEGAGVGVQCPIENEGTNREIHFTMAIGTKFILKVFRFQGLISSFAQKVEIEFGSNELNTL